MEGNLVAILDHRVNIASGFLGTLIAALIDLVLAIHQALAELVHGLAGIGLEQIAQCYLCLDHIEFFGAGKGVGVIGKLFLERAGFVDFRLDDAGNGNGFIELGICQQAA